MYEEEPALGWLAVSTILANLVTTGFALMLLRRHPNPRLRYLVFLVGVVSVIQTAGLFGRLNVQGLADAIGQFQYFITAMTGMAFLYVLWREISDRNRTDRMLRLAEHENQVMQSRLERKPSSRTGEMPAVTPPANSEAL